MKLINGLAVAVVVSCVFAVLVAATAPAPAPADASGQTRFPLAVNSTNGYSGSTLSATSLTAGRVTLASISTSSLYPISTRRGMALELTFGSDGANNDTSAYKVWHGVLGRLGGGSSPAYDAEIQLWGTGTVTYGTCVGAAAGTAPDYLPVKSAERLADTVTFTASAFCTAVQAAYPTGGTQVYSPADNTPGRVIIPEHGGADFFLVEIVKPSGGTYAFVLANTKEP